MKNILLIIISICLFAGSPSRQLHHPKPVTATDEIWDPANVASFEKRLEVLRNRYFEQRAAGIRFYIAIH